ncbi:MAG: hypothetical protein QNJ97_12595 [Myxococcota bacterium]|nr:hypothetical protein [Myxococcota bacterium]
MGSRTKTGTAGSTLGRLFLPLASLVVLAICWRLDLKWMTVPIVGFLVVYYFVLPRLISSRLDRFRREALRLLAIGKPQDIQGLVRRNVLLQLFGPRAILDAKLALAFAASGQYLRSIAHFERALPTAIEQERIPLRIGLAKALFVTGDLARAAAEGQKVLDQGTRLPELLAIVARSRVGLAKNDDVTRALIEEGFRLAEDGDPRLMLELTRIELALATGRSPGQVPDAADSQQGFIRAWIHLVRGLVRHHQQDAAAAKKGYDRCIKTDANCFAAAVARERLLSVNSEPESRSSPPVSRQDAPVRRKKKRRKR